MQTIDLSAKKRTKFGSREARRIRNDGNIPGTLYGHGISPLSLRVDTKALHSVLHTKAGENVVINLNIENVSLKESTCLIKEIQHDPITEKITHVDFTLISLTENIEVQVPIVVLNAEESAGVKEGGVLDIVHHEITVSCLPTNIPEKIEVDVRALKIGDIIHTKDLQIPEGVSCILEADESIITLHPPAKEEEPTEETGAAEPEVIEKGKKVEEGAEGAAAAPKEKAAAPEAKAPKKA